MNGIPPDRRIIGRWAEERHCSTNEVIVEKNVAVAVAVVVVVEEEEEEANDERMRIS